MDATQRYLMHCLTLLLGWLCYPLLAIAASPVMVPEGEYHENISQYVAVLEDPGNSINRQNLTDPNLQFQFEPNHSEILRLSRGDSTYWLRVTLHNPYQQSHASVVIMNNLRVHDYLSLSEKTFTEDRNAIIAPLSSPAGSFGRTSLLLNIPPLSSKSYWFEVSRSSFSDGAVEIASLGGYRNSENKASMLFSLLVGWLLATAAWFLRLRLRRQCRLAGYGALHSLSSALVLTFSLGIFTEHFGLPLQLANALSAITLSGCLFALFMFLRKLDWIGPRAARIRQSARFLAWLMLALGFLVALTASAEQQSDLLKLAILAQLGNIALLVVGQTQRPRPATILLSTMIMTLAGLLLLLMLHVSLLPWASIAFYLTLSLPLVTTIGLVWATFEFDNSRAGQSGETHRGIALTPLMLGQIGHDLRSPINGVLGMNELLSDTPLTDSQRDFSEMIGHSGREMLHIANELSVLSKIQDDHLELEHGAFDLVTVINQTLVHFQLEANRKQLELVVDYADAMPAQVLGDRNRMHTFLYNLFARLISYTEQGELRAHVLPQFDQRGRVESVAIQILLHGTFSNRDDVRQLVDQLDPDLSASTGSWSMLVAQRLLRYMKGSIQLERLTQQDASLTVYLPVQVDALETEAAESSDDSLIGFSILLVDDNASLRKVVEKQVRRWGVRVDSTHSGKEALAMMRNQAAIGHAYHAAVIDQDMPVMNGLELMQRLQDDDSIDPKPAVLMLTGLSISSVREQANALGIFQLLTKPASGERLKHALLDLKYRPGRPGRSE